MLNKIIFLLYKQIFAHLSGRGLHRYKIFVVIANKIKNNLKKNYIEIEDHNFFLDDTDALRLSINKSYEKFELSIAKSEIKKGNTVVELGSHIGYFTINFAKYVGPNGKVFAFEPDPENFSILQKNISENNYHNIVAEKKAILEKRKKIKFFLSKLNQGDHRVYPTENNVEYLEVDAISFDDYFKDQHIDFIWMTIQGSEIAAIEGMNNFLTRTPNLVMIIDFNPRLISEFGRSPKECLDLLQHFGFKIYDIDRKENKIHLSSIEYLLNKYSIKKYTGTHLLCKKSNDDIDSINKTII